MSIGSGWGGGSSGAGGAKGRRENYKTVMAKLKGTDKEIERATAMRETVNSGLDKTIKWIKQSGQKEELIQQGVSRMERIRAEINRTENSSEIISVFSHIYATTKNPVDAAIDAVQGAITRQDFALSKRMRKAFDGK